MCIDQSQQSAHGLHDFSSTNSPDSFQTRRLKSLIRLCPKTQTSYSRVHAQLIFCNNSTSRTSTNQNSTVWLYRLTTVVLLLAHISDLAMALTVQTKASSRSRCYSCASENMKENFLSRNRGPKRRKEEPKLYDNMCDLDTWMIREKSAVECDGSCFKWQQVLNDSGVFSYSTIRGCYNKMFDLSSPETEPEKTMNECIARQKPFDCVDQSSLMDWQCFCQGDYCNSARPLSLAGIGMFTPLVISFLAFFLS